MKGYSFRVYQWIASICVAVFIVNFALCMTAMNKSVYKNSDTECSEEALVSLSKAEATLYYEQIQESFCSFFKNKYEVSGYEISGANTAQLNSLKFYYRWAWVLSIVSLAGGIYCFIYLSRRRDSRALVYGSAVALLITALQFLGIVRSTRPVYAGVREMIFHKDYSFFSQGDILLSVINADFARHVAVCYVVTLLGLVLLMVAIHGLIRFMGRPYKY